MIERYSIVIPEESHDVLCNHLIRKDGQEDLCFATYNPSCGEKRFSGIISEIILPNDSERLIHGNVGFLPNYLERVIKIAISKKEGIAFLHSHPYTGWQGMSYDDIVAEKRISPSVFATTYLPLLGLTVGSDCVWSGRYWIKDKAKKRTYNKRWAESVKILGKRLKTNFNDQILKPNFDNEKQLRTISAWGKHNQEDLSRLRVGIVGLGSVGSIVAEILARTGISNFTLIDFDRVEKKNLDRLTNIYQKDIGQYKVDAVKKGIRRSATSPKASITPIKNTLCSPVGLKAALDCDILFSCVDRPWPRQILNFIAYAHLIPVIDGGILVRTNKDNSNIVGADWKVQTVGYKRACLECLGQYKTENANLEKDGFLDDPSYIQGMEDTSFLNAHENVFAFSSHLASMEVLQMLNMLIAPSGIADVGQQMYHFVLGKIDVEKEIKCNTKCLFQSIVGKGDHSGIILFEDNRYSITPSVQIQDFSTAFQS